MGKTITFRPPAPWWWSPPPARAAGKWPPASASSITSTSGALWRATPSSKTFPIWNLPLKHPVNLAYEAATADLDDVNMIDPFHLQAYGETTVNYNRDVEVFPVLAAMFEQITGSCPYKSPTDMGVNMAGNCIIDDAVCQRAAQQEIIRRYYEALCDRRQGRGADCNRLQAGAADCSRRASRRPSAPWPARPTAWPRRPASRPWPSSLQTAPWSPAKPPS